MALLLRMVARTAGVALLWCGSVATMSAVLTANQHYESWWSVTLRWDAQCAGAPYVANERPFIHPVPGECNLVRPWEIWKDVTD